MKKHNIYHPDYLKMYPCLKNRPDILKFLKKSDRKQEYLEYDLKVKRTRKNKNTMEVTVLPQKEESYEQLLEEQKQFPHPAASPEELLVHEMELENLRSAVESLAGEEKNLLYLRYWLALSQEKTAQCLGVTQQSISYQERRILRKLEKILKS